MMRTTQRPIEREEVKLLEMAIKGYQTEYNKLPELGATDETKFVESTGLLMKMLAGRDEQLNPRMIPFYESMHRPTRDKFGDGRAESAPTDETDVRDLKGNRYRLHFDWNGDKHIPNPREPGKEILGSVIVYSAGPDGDYSTWEDNFTSWENEER
ncbi:hypothetical protein [Roseimicrobium gellanilyticum]|nr:hypothetical protein [Roseimicrobium gellanilyticum]